MGNTQFEGTDNWGKFFYILCSSDLTNLDEMEQHPQFFGQYDISKDEIMFIYKFTEYQQLTIVNPFLRGEYSKIDSSYFYNTFSKYRGDRVSVNWLIYHKSPILRQKWEDAIGVTLPEDAEVWPRPLKQNEVYAIDELLESV